MNTSPYETSNTIIRCMKANSRVLCVVCGADAIGRNFDAYTCLSCKAFFRRNAYNEQLRNGCRVLATCKITTATRRHCSACRLNKCFRKGMKKELIRSLTAIGRATSGMITNGCQSKQSSSSTTTISASSVRDQSALLYDDWSVLTNIRNIYDDYCVKPFQSSHDIIPLALTGQPYRSRMKIQRLIDIRQKYLHVIILFIKRVLQHNQFMDTHYECLKDNFRTLLSLNTVELMKSNVIKDFPWEHDRFLFESILTESLVHRLEKHISTYPTLLPHDPLIMKLYLIILSLTRGVSPLYKKQKYSPSDFSPFSSDILRSHDYYVILLWKYLTYRMNYTDAVMYTVKFIQHFLRRQTIEADLLDEVQNRDDHGQLLHLMETTIEIPKQTE